MNFARRHEAPCSRAKGLIDLSGLLHGETRILASGAGTTDMSAGPVDTVTQTLYAHSALEAPPCLRRIVSLRNISVSNLFTPNMDLAHHCK